MSWTAKHFDSPTKSCFEHGCTDDCPVGKDPMTVDKNHLPAELAAQLLACDARALTAVSRATPRERLYLDRCAEEALEVAHAISKIGRFGWSINPYTGVSAREKLSTEIGHLRAALRVLEDSGLADQEVAARAMREKFAEYVMGIAGELVPDGVL